MIERYGLAQYDKISIGEIPIEEAKAFFDLKELGIDRIPQESSTIYTVGNFKTVEEAKVMQATLIRKGQQDAIVVVNLGGNIISVEEYKK